MEGEQRLQLVSPWNRGTVGLAGSALLMARLPHHTAEVPDIVLGLWSGQCSEFWAEWAVQSVLDSVFLVVFSLSVEIVVDCSGYTDIGSAGGRAQ